MNGTIEPNEVELVIRDRIAGLPTAQYGQGITNPAWTETDTAGVLEVDNGERAHLKYRVFVSSSPAARSQFETALVVSRLVVEFLFRLRAGQEVADGRAAWVAAKDVRKVVMSHPDPRFSVVLVDAGRAYGDEDGEVRLIQQAFDVTHELEV